MLDDLMQTLFLRVYEKSDKLETSRDARRYLIRSAANAGRNYRASMNVRKFQDTLPELAADGTPYESLLVKERQETFNQALEKMKKLPYEEQEAILYASIGSIRAASEESGIAFSTLRYRKNRGLKHLRKAVGIKTPRKYREGQ